MRRIVLLAITLLQVTACLAQEREHVRPHILLQPGLLYSPETTLRPALPPPERSRAVPADAQVFVAEAETEFARVSQYVARAGWVKNSFVTFDTDWLEARANAEQARVLLGLVKRAARYDGVAVDPVTRRKLDFIKLATAIPSPDRADALEELAALNSRLDSSYATLTVPYRGRTLTREEASKLAQNSTDPSELKEIWEAARANLPPMRADYARSIALANEGARALGFKDVGDMWRSSYDMPPEAFADLVDRLWAQVEPLYKSYMCYVRARLSDLHGSAEQPRTGYIRNHLMLTGPEKMLHVYLPNMEAGNYDLSALLREKHYSVDTMVKTAERFYTSLGFEPLPQTFWQRSMFTRPRDREVGCWPTTWSLDDADDVRFAGCLEVNAADFRMTHHELGHAFYYRAYKNQPYLLHGGANDGFHEAVGDFIALSAQTPTYLHQLGLLATVPGPETDIPFLFKQFDWHGGALAINLAMEKWRWDVFAGKIAPEAYNDAWWQRQQQYRGIAPPGPRPADAFDPGGVWHMAGHVPVIRYFLAEIYQFQFHRAACRIAGWKGPLHRCSIYGNKEVGARLNAMLSMGASKPWAEALAAFTGERELDASAMVEYFAPLQRWLDEKNKGEQCGW